MRSFPNYGWHPLIVWGATAFVGGVIGGLCAVALIGLDPHPFRSVPAVAEESGQKPCYRVDLNGKIMGPC